MTRSDHVRVTKPHRHGRGQLFGATHGLLTAEGGRCRWVVPPTHAVWIPPHVPHGVQSHGAFSGWSVYVAAGACSSLPQHACVLKVNGLLREAVVRASSWKDGSRSDVQLRLASVIVDEIGSAPHESLGLPMPSDKRLIRIARAMLEAPSDARKLHEWAEWADIAPRTLTRRFTAETGFSFTDWRQRLRLLTALEHLAEGGSVTAIALELGYESTSAFIAMFRKHFGVTPGRYGSPVSQT